MAIVDADVNPADWNKTDPQAIVDATLQHPSLAAGSIIDLHDSSEMADHGEDEQGQGGHRVITSTT